MYIPKSSLLLFKGEARPKLPSPPLPPPLPPPFPPPMMQPVGGKGWVLWLKVN